MEIKQVAEKLVSLCRNGDWATAQKELYAENAVSIEPEGGPWEKAEGMDAIRKKGEQWAAMVEEVHGGTISDPIISEDHFAIRMQSDVTFKGMGRSQIDELAVYKVKDGKIVLEQFFYTPQPG